MNVAPIQEPKDTPQHQYATNERRKPLIKLERNQSHEFRRAMDNTVAWLLAPIDPATGHLMTNAKELVWVMNTPQLRDSYRVLCEHGWLDGAIWISYNTWAFECGIGARQMIRRANVLRAIGLIQSKTVQHLSHDGWSSNNYGLIDPHQALNVVAVAVYRERIDPETRQRVDIFPRMIDLNLSALPPLPIIDGGVRQPAPVFPAAEVLAEAFTPAQVAAREDWRSLRMPPWWAVQICEQEKVTSLDLQARVWAAYERLRDAGLVRDAKRPGKVIRGIARHMRAQEAHDEILEELLLTGRSLTAEQELQARRGRMIALATRALIQGDTIEMTRRWLRTTSELAAVRLRTPMDPAEVDEAIDEAVRLLHVEQERHEAAQADTIPQPVIQWVQEGVRTLRLRASHQNERPTLDQIGLTLWANKVTYQAPEGLTETRLRTVLEAIRLQE